MMAFGRGQFGRRKYGKARPVKGVMNGNEAKFAALLEEWKRAGTIRHYGYESITLTLAPRTTILIDFHVIEADGTIVFYECKAGMKNGKYRAEDDAVVKLKVAAEKFPYFKILVTWDHKAYARKYQEVGAHGADDNTADTEE